jgi:hypothetical protein
VQPALFTLPCFYGVLPFSYVADVCHFRNAIMAWRILCHPDDILLAKCSRRGLLIVHLVRLGEARTMSGREDYSSEFYGLPEYVITHIRVEKLKNNNRRVYHWEERNGMLIPSFMAFIAGPDLIVMSEAVQESLIDITPGGRVKSRSH